MQAFRKSMSMIVFVVAIYVLGFISGAIYGTADETTIVVDVSPVKTTQETNGAMEKKEVTGPVI